MPIPELSKRFGKAVRDRRMHAELTQEALAERAGLHPTYISMVERGIRNVTLVAADKIAGALGAPLEEILAEAKRFQSRSGRKN